MVVTTRSSRSMNSAQKRILPSESPVKNRITRRNVNTRTTKTSTMMTRATATSTTTSPKKRSRRNLTFELEAAASDGENYNGQSDTRVKRSKSKIIDHGISMTPPPTPEPDSDEMNCDSCSSSNEYSPVKCNPIVEAKRLLSIGAVDGVVGREKEQLELLHFLEKCLDTKESSTIFISGPPGTGKTLTVESIITKLQQNYAITRLFYNSMDFSRGSTIYTKIANDLGLTDNDKARYRDKLIAPIEKFITKASNMVILTIDEIDQLDKDLVDAILDWPKAKRSKLILIGIANTITSSSLNKLTCAFEQNSVKKISFRPYTKDQIIAIIKSRLQHLMKQCELISPAALELCSRKISVYSGDARKALDIVRQSIELAEREKCYSNSFAGLKITSDDGDNPGSPRKMARLSSPQKSPRRSPRKRINLTDLTPGKPLVEPRHITNIVNAIYGNKLFSEENVSELTIQQQAILCCIVCYGKEKLNKEMTIPSLYKLFIKGSSELGIVSYKHQLTMSDFLCICQILESNGLVRIKQAKELRLTKISLSVNEDEVAQRISEKSLIQDLMKHIYKLL